MLSFTLLQKAKIVAGPGCSEKIAEVLEDAGYKKPFIVYDQGVKMCGITDKIVNVIKAAGYECVEFDGVLPDPPCDMVERAADICKSNGCDCVIAIGGGSSIDTAKGITVLRFNSGSILDYAKPDAKMNFSPGLISIPTTSGTGAELSNGIIISDPVAQVKWPIVGTMAMSEYVLLDANLTLGMPPGLTIMTGLDVMSHAIEAYTTVLAGPMSDIICEKIIQEVVEYLPRAIKDGNDVEARQRMLLNASLGGWMLQNACAHVGHSLAHVVGAKFHVPHGAACAFSTPPAIRFIAPVVPEKVKKIGTILGAEFNGDETPEQIGEITAEAYIKFRNSLGLKKPEDFGLEKGATECLACEIPGECFAPLTPRKVTEENAKEMLSGMFQ